MPRRLNRCGAARWRKLPAWFPPAYPKALTRRSRKAISLIEANARTGRVPFLRLAPNFSRCRVNTSSTYALLPSIGLRFLRPRVE